MRSHLRATIMRAPVACLLGLGTAVAIYGSVTTLLILAIFPNQGRVPITPLSWLGCPTGGTLMLDTMWGRRYYNYLTMGYSCAFNGNQQRADELRMLLVLIVICTIGIWLWWLRNALRQERLT
jgi:hypothetical protein